MKNRNALDKWLTGQELAQALGITQQWVSKMRLTGKLTRAIRRGGVWLYPPEVIYEYKRQRNSRRKNTHGGRQK